jgi:hypothetical protein
MGPTLSPETSAFKLQTTGKFQEEYKLHSEHGESLKTAYYIVLTGTVEYGHVVLVQTGELVRIALDEALKFEVPLLIKFHI